MCRADRRQGQEAGLSLPELLIALSTGVLVAGMALQALLGEARGSAQLGQRLQQRAMAQQALALIRSDAARADQLLLAGEATSGSPCGLAGRTLLLEARSVSGSVTYSVGAAPSSIWRGQVLMRCGPAFGLDGEPSTGTPQNRVVLDGLQKHGIKTERKDLGLVMITLQDRNQILTVLADRGARLRTL